MDDDTAGVFPLPTRDAGHDEYDPPTGADLIASGLAAIGDNARASIPYRDYLNSPEWKRRRRVAVDRAERRCHRCGSRGPFNVHHLTYERRGYELQDDLEVLCRECHRKEHGK